MYDVLFYLSPIKEWMVCSHISANCWVKNDNERQTINYDVCLSEYCDQRTPLPKHLFSSWMPGTSAKKQHQNIDFWRKVLQGAYLSVYAMIFFVIVSKRWAFAVLVRIFGVMSREMITCMPVDAFLLQSCCVAFINRHVCVAITAVLRHRSVFYSSDQMLLPSSFTFYVEWATIANFI